MSIETEERSLTLTDGTKLRDIVDEVSCSKIADIVNRGICDTTLAYLCLKHGVLDTLNCEKRISPLDDKEVFLCGYERSKLFDIVRFSLESRLTIAEAESRLMPISH